MAEADTDDLTDTERQVLGLFEGHDLKLSVSEVRENTDLTEPEARAAVESLEMKGELETQPVLYQQTGS